MYFNMTGLAISCLAAQLDFRFHSCFGYVLNILDSPEPLLDSKIEKRDRSNQATTDLKSLAVR